jgi:hypothetical protein
MFSSVGFIVSKFKYLLEVLKTGKELKHAGTWKKVQYVTTLLTGLVVSLQNIFPEYSVSPEAVNYAIQVIANIGGHISGTVFTEESLRTTINSIGALVFMLISPYLTVATTSKVGLPGLGSTTSTE